MSYENILYSVEGGVCRVTINRPDKMNALNHQTITELGAAFDAAKADDSVRALVLTGAGIHPYTKQGAMLLANAHAEGVTKALLTAKQRVQL